MTGYCLDTDVISAVLKPAPPLHLIRRLAVTPAGQPLAEPDLRIASIALANELTVVTGNVRHFARVPGLVVESWLKEPVDR